MSCSSATSRLVRRTKKVAGSRHRRKRRGFRIEEDDEVDIARIVELAGAMLAHGENGVARFLAGICLIEESSLPVRAPRAAAS